MKTKAINTKDSLLKNAIARTESAILKRLPIPRLTQAEKKTLEALNKLGF